MRLRLRSIIIGGPRVAPLSIAHGVAGAADAYVTVSLAGSLFFNVSPDASRHQVLLYLTVTLVPLAFLAPLIGPTVDRFHGRVEIVGTAAYVVRAGLCLLLASSLYELSFYFYAIALLVTSRASVIVKQALVPAVTDDPSQLVSTSALLARTTAVIGGIGGATATMVLAFAGAPWVLRTASVLFLLAAASMIRLRSAPRGPRVQREVEFAEMRSPTVMIASIGYSAIRGAVGFFVFTMAFTLRRASEPAWVYGAAIGLYGAGAFAGNLIAGKLRSRFPEERLLAIAIGGPTALCLVGILGVSRPLLITVALVVGLSTTLGRPAFDSLLQQRASEALRGRASARFETRFSLAYVFGAASATAVTLPAEASMAVLSAIYLPALFLFLRAMATARRLDAPAIKVLSQIAVAEEMRRAGDERAAVLQVVAAIDIAQLSNPEIGERPEREELEGQRAAALRPDQAVDAERAIALARALVTDVASNRTP